jgi:hypothetical protein
MMMLILTALAAHTKLPGSASAVALCRPVLARKAGGEIATLDVASSHTSGGQRVISGKLTAFLGMGHPAAGSASAHHLIRADFTFRCQVGPKGVRRAAVLPVR